MIVTLDINVFLDVFQKREPHYLASSQVMNLVAEGKLIGVCPAHGLTTLYYLVRKHSAKSDAESSMDRILRQYRIGNLDAAGWQRARQLPFEDFEDAVVAAVAEASGSHWIVTRNTDDFEASPVPAITPVDFLSQYAPTLS